LKPGGVIYIAYRDQYHDFDGIIQKKYFEEILRDYNLYHNISKINQAKDDLIHQGQIIEHLESKDEDGYKTKPKIETIEYQSSYYARTLADMAVMGLSGFLESNEKEFDKRKLEFILNEIKNAALMKVKDEKERRFGLGRVERDGKHAGCWSSTGGKCSSGGSGAGAGTHRSREDDGRGRRSCDYYAEPRWCKGRRYRHCLRRQWGEPGAVGAVEGECSGDSERGDERRDVWADCAAAGCECAGAA